MSNPFLGQLVPVAFDFAPRGWALCNGQAMSISANGALFALLGTTYGGNGTSDFMLPDLRGRVPKGVGVGPGLAPYALGEIGGVEATVLSVSQLPSHTHPLAAASGLGTTEVPTDAVPAAGGSYAAAADVPLAPTGSTGSGEPLEMQPPFVTVNWIIAVEGVFPSSS